MSQHRLLLLMRHAKSSWKDDSLADDQRPLNRRGKEAARRMGECLREQGLAPAGIVASSAVRAQETARRVNESGEFGLEIVTAPELYLSGPSAYIRAIGRIDNAIHPLLVIGHNPDIETLVKQLTGEDEDMPTGAVACVEVRARNWAWFSGNPSGTLREVWRPRDLFGDDDA